MTARRLAILSIACTLAACAARAPAPAPATQSTFKQPTPQDDFDCKVEGLVFRDFGVMRDEGRDLTSATAAIKEKYAALAQTPEEKVTATRLLRVSDSIGGFAYALKPLQPKTLMYFGANVCLMIASGDRNKDNGTALAQHAVACQKQYPPATAEPALRKCITDEAIRLVRPTS